MKVVVNPTAVELKAAIQRPALERVNLDALITDIFQEVAEEGDEALFRFAERFDKVSLSSLEVAQVEIDEAENALSEELKLAIRTAASNIERFHKSQKKREVEVETTPGVNCWRKSVGIQNVGLYIPGGSAPLFSTVLMLGIPAKLANCKNRILCTPPAKDGTINPAILYAAKVSGVTKIYKVGGAQAIAAMTLGTETIPKVDKLFGPGNQYVTAAKVYAQQLGIPIDMPAGPSEVLVCADETISPEIIAADLLAQAEHGTDSQVILLTDSEQLVTQVQSEIDKQLVDLPRAAIASGALKNSRAIVTKPEYWVDIINEYAPEHLIVMGKYEELIVENVVNAGSVFIGVNTAESFGDYASGTNHTLPTAGFARAYSGVSLDSFVKKITYQRVSEEGLKNLGPTVVTMAEAEGLSAHARAVSLRYIPTLKVGTLSLTSEKKSLILQDSLEVTEDIQRFIRPDLRNVRPYSSARDEFEGIESRPTLDYFSFLDANENGLFSENNRYPDPFQKDLKKEVAKVKDIAEKNLFLGNGSDEVLDLIYRLTTTPYLDKVAYLNPSYGMYPILAKLNALDTVELNLDKQFEIDIEVLLQQAEGSRLLILCNPNNPTGKAIPKSKMLEIVTRFSGIVVVDEAYADFCPQLSMADQVEKYPNLIVVQTLSKAFGLAGLRIGMAICSENWVKALNTIKPPYNISSLVQQEAISVLKSTAWDSIKSTIISERERLNSYLQADSKVEKVFPSEANFVLFRIQNASQVYEQLIKNGVVVRNRSSNFNCENTLRVSVGSPAENNRFIELMKTL